MNKKISLGLTISIAALVAAVTFIVTSFFTLRHFNEKVQAVKEKAAKYERLEMLDTYVRQHYYTDLNEDDLMNGMLKGYVAGLRDPYSQYLTPQEYKALREKESGTAIGIGVTAQLQEDGYILLIEVQEGSPAEAAGLKANDVIVAVEDQDVSEISFDEAVSMIKGEVDTRVRIRIRRDDTERNYTIVRKTFNVKTVKGRLLTKNIGYISISNFRDNTAEQFQETLDELLANGATALIFDVRGNGGGLLRSLEQILDPLLPEGEIAIATYQDGSSETVVYSDASELDVPMVVLINGSSASAAELFAASLRDFGKAKLVGETTFGKGIMQVTTSLDDGSGLTLTVATYQTTRSECYHGVGVSPDQEVSASEETVISNVDPKTDPQLAAAIEMLR
ncbi:MAG: S41 family peptidase [Ruminococcus sp.]|nr:S41 family peptidase [Ruminococcus sp.]